MKLLSLFVICFLMSSIAAASVKLKTTTINISNLADMGGKADKRKARYLSRLLDKRQIVVMAFSHAGFGKRLQKELRLDVANLKDTQELADILKEMVSGSDHSMGYVFVTIDGNEVKKFTFFYHPDDQQEWLELGEKTNVLVKSSMIDSKALRHKTGTRAIDIRALLDEGETAIMTASNADFSGASSSRTSYLVDGITINDEQKLATVLKEDAQMSEESMGYVFAPTSGNEVKQLAFFYYPDDQQDWLELGRLDELAAKINLAAMLGEVKPLDLEYVDFLDTTRVENEAKRLDDVGVSFIKTLGDTFVDSIVARKQAKDMWGNTQLENLVKTYRALLYLGNKQSLAAFEAAMLFSMKLGKIKSKLAQASQAQNSAKEQLKAAWAIFDEMAVREGYTDAAEAKNKLGVMHVYESSIAEGIITHSQFRELELAIMLLAQNNRARTRLARDVCHVRTYI